MHEQCAHSNNRLSIVQNKRSCQTGCYDAILTPPGMKLPLMVAPEDGTIRSNGDTTPGLVRRDSFMTAVCHHYNQYPSANHLNLARYEILLETATSLESQRLVGLIDLTSILAVPV
jgi:hypothetical protein